jgi:hypothetical protein
MPGAFATGGGVAEGRVGGDGHGGAPEGHKDIVLVFLSFRKKIGDYPGLDSR